MIVTQSHQADLPLSPATQSFIDHNFTVTQKASMEWTADAVFAVQQESLGALAEARSRSVASQAALTAANQKYRELRAAATAQFLVCRRCPPGESTLECEKWKTTRRAANQAAVDLEVIEEQAAQDEIVLKACGLKAYKSRELLKTVETILNDIAIAEGRRYREELKVEKPPSRRNSL